jgi:2-hydroxy-6-oxonona-2,4-dienedioate hydrolase/2-hydroxy-6-oxo-6-(2'-carboxyphenyl)-hexa-2,4-dienoate hydrolase
MKRVPIIAAGLALAVVATAHAETTIAEKDATVYGQKMHYLEAGSGAPLILLHGTGGEGARWMPNIKELSSDFRVIAVDHIGFGQSDKPLTQYHTGVFAEFVAGLMKSMGVPRASFVGQSMGANVVLYMAIHYPEMVDRIVLVNGGGFRAAGATSGAREGRPDWHSRQIANSATLSESREYLNLMYFDDATFVTDEAVAANLALRLKSAYTISSMSLAGEKGLGTITEEEVKGIRAPTLLVWGANDTQSTLASQDRLNATIAGSQKVVIDKAGHYPFLEHSKEFNQFVRGFLKRSGT